MHITEGAYQGGKITAGRTIWANGDHYIGEFKNQQKNGRGRLTKANGDI